jgi:hypothetical protein
MGSPAASDGTASFKGFAHILGERSPSYVTQLKAEGRLVLTPDGKRVKVAESLALIRETADPSKAGVAARHEAARQGQASAPAAPPPGGDGDDGDSEGDGDGHGQGYQHWRERNERAKALAAERDNAIADGKLFDAAEVEAVVADAVTVLRGRLEALPDILGPQLAAETDEGRARALIAESIEHALEETARQFANIAKGAADE